ncbi:MAG: 50S ribosomal protein L30 [bacterium]
MQQLMRIKLVRSACGRVPKHRATVRGLGLTRTNQERVVMDTPAIRGMVAQVPYLVKIIEEGIKEKA